MEPESRFLGSVSIFTDETEDIEYHTSTEISIPWWVLLLKRNHKGSLLQHYRITPDRFGDHRLGKEPDIRRFCKPPTIPKGDSIKANF